jgi:hypothetical protein
VNIRMRMLNPRIVLDLQISTLENGLIRVSDVGSRLEALYDGQTGAFHAGFDGFDRLAAAAGFEIRELFRADVIA